MTRVAISSIIAAMLLAHSTVASSETLMCAMAQGFRTCTGPHGYVSREFNSQGMAFGSDSDGNQWTTSRWNGFETTTAEPPDDR